MADSMGNEVVTAIGTSNIALSKYWGRKSDALNIPMNSSVSLTLDENLKTTTSVTCSDALKADALYINGQRQDMAGTGSEKNRYVQAAIEHMKEMAGERRKVLVVSENNFPTGAGIASSASGSVALVYALSHLFKLNLGTKDMSLITRRISGSACRSVVGGVARWNKGAKDDGSDSYAEQVFDENHWPDLIDVLAITSAKEKKVSSSEGHSRTVRTSSFYRMRPEVAEQNTATAVEAIRKRDMNSLAEVIMRESNSMHSTMLDSYPPIIYLNDASRDIIERVHALNQAEGSNIAAYTFDAGPNAHIITLKGHTGKVMEMLKGVQGISGTITAGQGHGPMLLGEDASLINENWKTADEAVKRRQS